MIRQEEVAYRLCWVAEEAREIEVCPIRHRLWQLGTKHVTVATADVAGAKRLFGARSEKCVDVVRKAVHLIIVDAGERHVTIREADVVPARTELFGVSMTQCREVVVSSDGILSRGTINDGTSLDVLIADRHICQFHFRVAVLIAGLLPLLFYLSNPFVGVEFLNGLTDTRCVGGAQFDSTEKHLIACQPTANLSGGMFLSGREHHGRLFLDSRTEYRATILALIISESYKDRVPRCRYQHLRLRFALTRDSRQRNLADRIDVEVLLYH